MPELPEVETVCRGLIPQISGRTVTQVLIKQPRLRWSIPTTFAETLRSQSFQAITRRGKYLLFDMSQGTVIAHLGMSGSFRVCTLDTPLKKHDHVFIRLDNQRELRYHDPRRFGSIHWTDQDPLHTPYCLILAQNHWIKTLPPKLYTSCSANVKNQSKPALWTIIYWLASAISMPPRPYSSLKLAQNALLIRLA